MENREIIETVSIDFYDDETRLSITTDEKYYGWKITGKTEELLRNLINEIKEKEPFYEHYRNACTIYERDYGVKRMDLF